MNGPLLAMLLATFTGEQVAAIIAGLVPVIGGIGYGLKYLIDTWRALRAERRKEQEDLRKERQDGEVKAEAGKAEKDKTLIEHLRVMADRFDRESQLKQRQYEQGLKRIGKLEIRVGKMSGHIHYLEGIIADKGIKFIPWNDEDAGGDADAGTPDPDSLKIAEIRK